MKHRARFEASVEAWRAVRAVSVGWVTRGATERCESSGHARYLLDSSYGEHRGRPANIATVGRFVWVITFSYDLGLGHKQRLSLGAGVA